MHHMPSMLLCISQVSQTVSSRSGQATYCERTGRAVCLARRCATPWSAAVST